MLLTTFFLFIASTSAQFGFFDQIFQQQQQQAQHQQQQQAPRNVPSDSEWYQRTYNEAYCDKYLCPGTLACVHFPHHCPCAWPGHEDKIELGDGSMLCVSKGGYHEGEAAKKVELARKGLL